MSSIIESIEAEALRVIEEARRRAQKIIEEAKAKAKEILGDKSYFKELEDYRRELEEKLEKEVERIISEAETSAAIIRLSGSKKIDALAKKIASMVTGIEIEE